MYFIRWLKTIDEGSFYECIRSEVSIMQRFSLD